MIKLFAGARRVAGGCLVAGMALLAGCAADGSFSLGGGSTSNVTVTDPTRMTRSGFLTDYARLKPNPALGGIECWRDPNLDAKKYDKVLISRIVVSLAPPKEKDKDKNQTVDPADLKTMTDYFHDSMTKALKPQMAVVDKAGPGTLVMRIALTSLVPTGVAESVTATLVPYYFVVDAGSGAATGRPAGATPYMGETGMEMQFRDGVSGAVIAECRDTEIGRKYAAEVDAGATGATETWVNGYLNSFQAWSYAKNAFDKWSLLVAQRLAELRGVKPKP